MRAKKSLGQHFLKDKNIARDITASLEALSGRALEVGPGTGVLTNFLLKRNDLDLRAVELDRESISFLHKAYPILADKLYQADFLDMNLMETFAGQQFSVIGNFPYNISSQIFFKIIENKELIPEVVGMVQKEVAQRMAANSGNRTYGILSILLQCWYDVEYLFTVDENVFIPPPKVKSAVVKLKRNSRKMMNCDEALFIRIVKSTFNQRRKIIGNSLKPLLGKQTLNHPLQTLRPERLNIEQFEELTRELSKILKP
ncbi:MAG: 16S rRNA (adenine(1518)-N(6)/adenine(1519)-N(6))-dimethyltransferase RsmA [Prevotellaceae bacterium]|jgi:16S rRNA (adenine1518-N6/adenine1519-N6)-dimethyltransferase|nr:16S rRNA (adenine(1518)-N(6)/adenine(1519)-N(6))-dimethyltransferase RsmA [Prevotellaceae bacterium]